MTFDTKKAQKIAERWLNENVFQGGYVEDFVQQIANDLVANMAQAQLPETSFKPPPGVEWLAVLTFSRSKTAKEFCERFDGHLPLGVGVADKVVLFSHSHPEVIFHFIGEGMQNYSLMSFTVTKIRVPKEDESSD